MSGILFLLVTNLKSTNEFETMTIISLLISAGSLAVAFFAYRKSAGTSARLLEIEEDRELDKKRARLIARIEKRREQNSGLSSFHHWWVFQIENRGYVDARNVNVIIGGKEFAACGFFDKNIGMAARIGAQSECTYKFNNADFRHRIPLSCLITWEDESGAPGRWEHSLTES